MTTHYIKDYNNGKISLSSLISWTKSLHLANWNFVIIFTLNWSIVALTLVQKYLLIHSVTFFKLHWNTAAVCSQLSAAIAIAQAAMQVHQGQFNSWYWLGLSPFLLPTTRSKHDIHCVRRGHLASELECKHLSAGCPFQPHLLNWLFIYLTWSLQQDINVEIFLHSFWGNIFTLS